jgi:hypothetical protein
MRRIAGSWNQKRSYAPAPNEQGAGPGHTKVHGKNGLIRSLKVLAAVLLPTPWPHRLSRRRGCGGGTANSARGTDSLIAGSRGRLDAGPLPGPELRRGIETSSPTPRG